MENGNGKMSGQQGQQPQQQGVIFLGVFAISTRPRWGNACMGGLRNFGWEKTEKTQEMQAMWEKIGSDWTGLGEVKISELDGWTPLDYYYFTAKGALSVLCTWQVAQVAGSRPGWQSASGRGRGKGLGCDDLQIRSI